MFLLYIHISPISIAVILKRLICQCQLFYLLFSAYFSINGMHVLDVSFSSRFCIIVFQKTLF